MSELSFPWRGGETKGYLALPAGAAPSGAVVVIHEWWGLNDDVRRMTDRFAAEGWVGLAVDLYGGRVTSEAAEALALSTEMKTADAVEIVRGAAAALSAHPACNGKIAVTGFCLGGGMTLAAVAGVDGLAAGVPFYGSPRDEFLHYDRMRAPILGHYASQDAFVDPARVRRIAEAVRAAGGSFELHFYEGGHAFMRERDPHAYHEPSARLAWERTTAFLRARLG